MESIAAPQDPDCRLPPTMEPCVMPPPPSRPWSRLAEEGNTREADPHARPMIVMHVSVGPRQPAAVVLFDIDAHRPLTCISLPVRILCSHYCRCRPLPHICILYVFFPSFFMRIVLDCLAAVCVRACMYVCVCVLCAVVSGCDAVFLWYDLDGAAVGRTVG
nr:hypothetical protein [Pandoravirus massiliensis]